MTIRWGIIGCGNVTEVKSGPAFQQATGNALTMWRMRWNCTAASATVMDAALAGYYGGRDNDFWTRPETWPGQRC